MNWTEEQMENLARGICEIQEQLTEFFSDPGNMAAYERWMRTHEQSDTA